jgi:hypothetical protein
VLEERGVPEVHSNAGSVGKERRAYAAMFYAVGVLAAEEKVNASWC